MRRYPSSKSMFVTCHSIFIKIFIEIYPVPKLWFHIIINLLKNKVLSL